MNVLVGLAGATAGAVAGELIRRRLSGSPYRLGEEVHQAAVGPGRLGFGDVKAGALVGLAAGAVSFHVVWWVGMLAFTGALVASHVPRRRGSIPLGPFLFASYVVVATVLG